MSATELLNAIAHSGTAVWTASQAIPDGPNARVTIAANHKLPRKLRRAMCNRRWEKKACKAISALVGYPVLAIRKTPKAPRPKPKALKCDFCASAPPVYRYPARDFDSRTDVAAQPVELEGQTIEAGTPVTQFSTGDWAACPTCHAMIQRDDRAGLALRSLNFMLIEDPEMAERADDLYQMLMELHAQFFDNRTGEPVLTEAA